MLERLVATISTLIHLVPAGTSRLDAASSSRWPWCLQEAGRVGVVLRRGLGGVLVRDWDHWNSDNRNWLLLSSSIGRLCSGRWCLRSNLRSGGGLDGVLSWNNRIWNRGDSASWCGRGVGHGDGGEGDGDGDRCGAVTSAA